MVPVGTLWYNGRPWSDHSRSWSTRVDHSRPCSTIVDHARPSSILVHHGRPWSQRVPPARIQTLNQNGDIESQIIKIKLMHEVVTTKRAGISMLPSVSSCLFSSARAASNRVVQKQDVLCRYIPKRPNRITEVKQINTKTSEKTKSEATGDEVTGAERSDTKRSEAKQSEAKRSAAKRSEAKRSEAKRSEAERRRANRKAKRSQAR